MKRFAPFLLWLTKPKNTRGTRLMVVLVLSILIAPSASLVFESQIEKLANRLLPEDGFVAGLDKTEQLATMLLIVGFVLVVVLLVRLGFMAWRALRRLAWPKPAFEPAPRLEHFLRLKGKQPEEFFYADQSIELVRHPNIYQDLECSGWAIWESRLGSVEVNISELSDKVCINLTGNAAKSAWLVPNSQALRNCGLQEKELAEAESLLNEPAEGYDGVKYTLAKSPLVLSDNYMQLDLSVCKTNFHTLSPVSKVVRKYPQIRDYFGHLEPSLNRVPNSLCLHYVIAMADDQYLCILRKHNMDYEAGTLSFSGEEQLSDKDLQNHSRGEVVQHWFKRALCEEVFPLADPRYGSVDKNWELIKEHIETMRVLSVFYEENFCNYALFGYVSLNVSSAELRDLVMQIKSRVGTGRDYEGELYCMGLVQLKAIIQGKTETLQSLFAREGQFTPSIRVARNVSEKGVFTLHSSSLYRMAYVLRAREY